MTQHAVPLEQAEAELLDSIEVLFSRYPSFSSALAEGPRELDELRSAVVVWAGCVRGAGHPPEWLVLRARRFLAASPRADAYVPRGNGEWERLDAFVIRCGIENYFRSDRIGPDTRA